MSLEKKVDQIDSQILELLQENARLSYTELGRQIGLSLPATAERVRRLEEVGVIEGYHTHLNLKKLGFSVQVFIQIQVPVQEYPRFIADIKKLPEISECHHITGRASFILKAHLTSMGHLEPLLTKLSRYGQTTSSVIMSSPLTRGPLAPLSQEK